MPSPARAESERAYREQLAIAEAVLPPGHSNIAGAQIGLGGILTDRGKASEAESMERLGPDDRRVARAQRALGLCLGAQGRHSEAEGLLLASYRTLGDARNWFHRTLREQYLARSQTP